MIDLSCMHPVATKKISVAFENAWLRVEHNEIRNSATCEDGLALRIAPADASVLITVVVPVLEDGRMMLVGRYRYATGAWSLEFPRACCQSGESTWKQKAAENLLADTGLRAASMRLLGGVEIDPALSSFTAVVVLAEGCRAERPKLACPGALIAGAVALAPDELAHLIRSGDVICGHTLAALSLCQVFGAGQGGAQIPDLDDI